MAKKPLPSANWFSTTDNGVKALIQLLELEQEKRTGGTSAESGPATGIGEAGAAEGEAGLGEASSIEGTAPLLDYLLGR